MPGLSNLNDKDFLRAFQVTDAVIQNNQPLFMFTWIGSILSVLVTILVSLVSIGFAEGWLIALVAFVYLLGVQGITVAIHIPLNNHIQSIKIENLNDEALADERLKFETKWNFFYYIRTSIAISVSVLLLIILTIRQIKNLQRATIHLAEENIDTVMPGLTHLQVAQPVSFAHHLLAYYEMLERDIGRFTDLRKRMNLLPLGAAALAGTSYPINRNFVAKKLGFDGVIQNSMDAVSDRDFLIEFNASAAILMMHLSRWSEELIMWSSPFFEYIEISDSFCTGSSIMPQKKNPDVPELVRGKTGRVYGHLMSLLTLMKGQPLAYNKDNQEDKEPIFDVIDTLRNTLEIFPEMIAELKTLPENMEAAAMKGYATATDLADYLVNKGVSFRDSHGVVAKVVRAAVSKDCDISEFDLNSLKKFSKVIDKDVYKHLTLEGSIKSRKHIGGTAFSSVAKAIQKAKLNLN